MNSKRVYSTVLFSFIFLTSLSCKKEPAEAEAVVKEAEKEEIIDPFYAVLNEDSSLEDYWNVFVADAIRSGKLNPGNGKVTTLFFGSEPDFASGVTADHKGERSISVMTILLVLKLLSLFGKILQLFNGFTLSIMKQGMHVINTGTHVNPMNVQQHQKIFP